MQAPSSSRPSFPNMLSLHTLRPRTQSWLALLAGALSVFSYAPFNVFPLMAICFGVLYLLWQGASPRRAAWLGLCWGFGQFWTGGGWLYVALHTYGGMAPWLTVFLLSIFFAYLALWGTLAGWLYARLRSGRPLFDVLLVAACWTFGEWLRGWVFTGVPWLAVGYTQSPPSPLAGYAPLFGVYGVGFILTGVTALIALALTDKTQRLRAGLLALAVVIVGNSLRWVQWTSPTGKPISISLIQPNIPQELKWNRDSLQHWLQLNLDLVRQHPAQLTALPETTLPLLEEQLPEGYLAALSEPARRLDGNVILGTFTRDADGQYRNSAISLGAHPRQVYSKHHLLPFGEFVPSSMRWLLDLVNIPMADQARGGARQAPMQVGDQLVAVNICYEDVFGEELIYALPQATLMLNMSNLAWYGDSHAQPQHLQIARMRAMEAGRPMLRSTNTGMTAVVMPDGSVPEVLPAFTSGALKTEVRGYTGLTPFARWGNWPVIGLMGFVLGSALWRRRS
ncbi:apolipoprotein N-acyltransferase [Uliginosibacterium sp. H3]|uniref:Apolipoprotein N-acyltransferase n=1 Tax=Uliginosibacterium silvisoli TaxID=3114758 RepID=A0ABU6K8J3_9RHOO|nr:apolipoprotein N-acyltransferase [Uliginosibacterium sp. H3]